MGRAQARQQQDLYRRGCEGGAEDAKSSVPLHPPRILGVLCAKALLFGADQELLPMAEYVITTAVGTGEKGFAGDGGPANTARLNGPFDVAFDSAGNLYFSDTFNHRIRRVDARSGVITTVAGNGEAGYSGDGGPAVNASLNEPYGIALDRSGNIFVADRLNRRVRRIDAASGIITTLAGTGEAGYSGAGGPGPRGGGFLRGGAGRPRERGSPSRTGSRSTRRSGSSTSPISPITGCASSISK